MAFKFINESANEEERRYKGILADAIAFRRKHVHRNFLKEVIERHRDDFDKLWIDQSDMDTDLKLKVSSLSAVDGSKCNQKLQAYPIFAVRAVSIPFSKNGNTLPIILEKMDVLIPHEKYEDRTILYMEGLEAEIHGFTVDRLRSIELMLMDGMFSVASRCKEVLEKYGCEPFDGGLVELLDYIKSNNLDAGTAIKIECGWKKNLYKEVAERANNVLTIYVGKSFLSNELFGDNILTDIGIINILAKDKVGMTKPQRITTVVGCKKYRKEVTLTRSYMKLSKNGAPLTVEVIGSYDEVEMNKIFNFLRRTSLKGYPLPLTQAHRKSKISNAECDLILSRALPTFVSELIRTGREAL
ncbi:hypothetical protein EYM_07725 [Ignicoccus islandicus DSM 13165]|uniref:NurA domain-containing protein n=1 Tax=Ignicoccus islandicus DSM 13165 TaxID=940295 RepID=A0A0U3G3Q5_9CREN|nr:DNA double-strand break repair nuclease NurA [Ignicoccus islandicus]ALU12812.1 hypothetical protein EYM_07725 [Ignicoccus islandicus DSM 13165]